MKDFDAIYMGGELSEDGEWQWNGTEWIPAQSANVSMQDSVVGRDVNITNTTNITQSNHQSGLREHVPEKSGLGSRILMGLIGLLMSLVIAAGSLGHRFGILSIDLSEDHLAPIRDSVGTLSTLLSLVIVLALVTFICSILTFIGFGFSKKALLGSSTIMLVVLLACAWVEWSIVQTLFGDNPENTTDWRRNLSTMPPTLFAYCNLAGLAVMALIARLSRQKPEGSSVGLDPIQADNPL